MGRVCFRNNALSGVGEDSGIGIVRDRLIKEE